MTAANSAKLPSRVARWSRWGSKGALSIADQGLSSGANFVLNILLARWLAPNEYGAFAVSLSIFLIISGIQNALILEPMSVIGPSRYEYGIGKYLTSMFWIQSGLAVPIASIVGAAAVVAMTMESPMGSALLALALATPLILLFWFLRRACYTVTRPDLAIRGSFTYAILVITGLALGSSWGVLSPFYAIAVMALASLAACSILLYSLSTKIDRATVPLRSLSSRTLLLENWSYGRWVLGTSVVYWLGSSAYLPLVAAVGGLEQAGTLKALENLLLPILHTITALGLLLLPWVAGQRAIRGRGYIRKVLPRFVTLNVSIVLLYVAVLLLLDRPLVEFLYGDSAYSDYLWLLPFLGAAAVIAAAAAGIGLCLKALERPDGIFWSQMGTAIFTLTLGIHLVSSLGLLGVAFGLVTTALIAAVITLFYLTALLRPRG